MLNFGQVVRLEKRDGTAPVGYLAILICSGRRTIQYGN